VGEVGNEGHFCDSGGDWIGAIGSNWRCNWGYIELGELELRAGSAEAGALKLGSTAEI
jgi:hypothetical protein